MQRRRRNQRDDKSAFKGVALVFHLYPIKRGLSHGKSSCGKPNSCKTLANALHHVVHNLLPRIAATDRPHPSALSRLPICPKNSLANSRTASVPSWLDPARLDRCPTVAGHAATLDHRGTEAQLKNLSHDLSDLFPVNYVGGIDAQRSDFEFKK